MKRAKEFGFLTMVFLVLLRLAIGWHFLYEGFHKLESFVRGETTDARPGNPPISKPWSSGGYFREAPGPLASVMRQQIGDPDDEVLARLTAQPPPAREDPLTAKPYLRTPSGLHADWEYYLNQYANGFGFSKEQRDLAQSKMEQNEDATVQWLTMPWDPALKRQAPDDDAELKVIEKRGFKAVEKASPSSTGTIKVLETPAERIDEYRKKVQEYRAMLDQTDATFGADVVGAKRLAAKADAAAMRKSLLDDLEKKTADFKESLASVPLTPEQQQTDAAFRSPTPLQWWIDGITAWGLAIMGACLLAGLLTRTNCMLAAGFLLMTYFVSPPWPWLPTPPNNEGNYLFVNKNVVEMFALLALATTASGRWFGLDSLIHWTLGALFGRKTPQAAPARRAA